MSMFSKLMGRIFGKSNEEKAAPAEEGAPTPAPEPIAEAAPEATAPAEATASETLPAEEGAPIPAPAPIALVDVEANLAALAKEHKEKLDWKKSIVDLLKLVGMDSSFGARKELAIELGYPEADIESKGSAEMNMWLHKQVMRRLAENGGSVPADLLD